MADDKRDKDSWGEKEPSRDLQKIKSNDHAVVAPLKQNAALQE